jgi:dihydropteroate synthase
MLPTSAIMIAKIMGVLNVTPDSFSDGGQHFDIADQFVPYYKQFLVGQVVGLMAGWFVDILCLV